MVFPAGAGAVTLPLAAGLAGAAAAVDAAGVDRSDLAAAAPFEPRSESPPIRAVGGLSLSLAGIFGSAVKPGPLAAGGMTASGPPHARVDARGCRDVDSGRRRSFFWWGGFMKLFIHQNGAIETALTKYNFWVGDGF